MRPALALVAVVTLAGIYTLPVCAAVRRPISFTVPDGARSMECIARRADGVELALAMFADSAGSTPYAVPAGRAWVLCSEDRSAWIIWVRACNGAGCGEWSNRLVVAQGLQDTLWNARHDLPLASYPWARSCFGRVGFALLPGDTSAVQIVSQETVQRQASARLVELYGYWMLRGVQITVPDHDPPRDTEAR